MGLNRVGRASESTNPDRYKGLHQLDNKDTGIVGIERSRVIAYSVQFTLDHAPLCDTSISLSMVSVQLPSQQ